MTKLSWEAWSDRMLDTYVAPLEKALGDTVDEVSFAPELGGGCHGIAVQKGDVELIVGEFGWLTTPGPDAVLFEAGADGWVVEAHDGRGEHVEASVVRFDAGGSLDTWLVAAVEAIGKSLAAVPTDGQVPA